MGRHSQVVRQSSAKAPSPVRIWVSPPILFLVGVLLAVAIAGEFVGASLLDAASRAGQRLSSARNDLDALVREQLADEIGLRGYIATRQRSFLEQGSADLSFNGRAARLRKELLDAQIPGAAARIDAFRTAHASWQRGVEAPLLADPGRSDALAKQAQGKDLLDTMRDEAKAIRADLEAADEDIAAKLSWRINATVGVSIGTITLFAIAALGLGLSRKEAVRALVREQSLVSALQQTLRVDGIQLPRTSVGFAYTSATREALVGGDLIDTWRADAERGWFLIADASGKGIEAARHSAFVQYAIRTLCAEFADPAVVLGRFNELFLDTFDDPGVFVVAFLGAFDARSGVMRYASAGHSIAFIQRPDGVEQLGPTGSIIGMDRAETYTERTVLLVPGDTIVLATDGLTECRDKTGEMLGDEGVITLLRTGLAAPQVLCDRLVAEAQRRSQGEVTDDLAILVLRILDTDVPSTAAPFSTLTAG
jgi:serine phosphatase RsbU (regulator of sigma subunit)